MIEHDAPTESLLEVHGITCASCVSHAETALRELPGVRTATVNLATRRARVLSSGPLDLATAADHMEHAGYPIAPAREHGAASHASRVGVHRAGHASDHGSAHGTGAGAASGDAHVHDDDPAQLIRAVGLAALLTLPVVVLEMGGHVAPAFHAWVHEHIGMTASRWFQLLATAAVMLIPGRSILRTGWRALRRRRPEMNSLVLLGTAAAWSYSAVVTIAPQSVPVAGRHVYFEAAAVIVTLILLGRWLEARARGRAGAAIERLVELRPASALRVHGPHREEVAVADVQVGDLLQLRPGERVAVDGEVVEGASHLDESMLTGESMPVAKSGGDRVVAGSINGLGALVYRATHVGADTVLSKIIRMVEDAQATRLPVQARIDRVTALFVPVVLGIALGATLLWLALGADLATAMMIGVSVLIIACPCAMGLATPVSVMAGMGRAAELGVLFRRGQALQELADVDVIAFDKTGTLTMGAPTVTRVLPTSGFEEDDVLRLAASVESHSEHPLATAIVREAQRRGLSLLPVSDFQSSTSVGVQGVIDARTVRVGRATVVSDEWDRLESLARNHETVVHVSRDGDPLGGIVLADRVHPDAASTIAALRRRGTKVVMLSGDAPAPVRAIASELGIEDFRSSLRPEDKLAHVEVLRARGLRVAFVGDGINDAPVLMAANVGIAIGSGTDVAIESADVVLASASPAGVVSAVEISRRTMRNITENLVWAFGYNVALIPVAAGLLVPFDGPLLSPVLAAGAMAASSVLVVLNALRLRRVRGGVA